MADPEQDQGNSADFDINAQAKAHGHDFGIPQGQNESDDAYRSRVAGELRQQGHIIEAHEAFAGRRYDDPEQGPLDPMTGVFGAAAQALAGRDYSLHKPERQIGDDIATGELVSSGGSPGEAAVRAMLDAFGPETGMDVIDALRPKQPPQ
jgi:hypothetical protein